MSKVKFQPIDFTDIEQKLLPTTRSLCLFASYSTEPNVSRNVYKYIQQLANHFDQVFFITNECRTNDETGKTLLPMIDNASVFMVPNKCLDFGMWLRVLLSFTKESSDYMQKRFDRIALVNDSCYILKPISHLFTLAKQNSSGFWGLTENFEFFHHLQSFFLVFERESAIQTLSDFVMNIDLECLLSCESKKMKLVEMCEVGISKFFIQKGIKPTALYSSSKLKETKPAIGPVAFCQNPTFYLWDRLLILGCPLLKRKRHNIQNAESFIHQHIDPSFVHTLRPPIM